MQNNITLKVGETYALELNSLGGAGYSWGVEKNDEKITAVTIKSGVAKQEVKTLPIGGAVKIKVMVTALAVGKSTIKLEQKRTWEANTAPADTCTLIVLVKEK